jgi:hypothetical protein
MLHEKGEKMIRDLKSIGAKFTWTECEDFPGSPEIHPDTATDRKMIMDYLDEVQSAEEHAYSLTVGSGGIVARCKNPDCKEVQIVNTMNEAHLQATLKDMEQIECYSCLEVGLETLSYVSFQFSDLDEEGWVMYD